MDLMLAELERGFRETWAGYRPAGYDFFLQQVDKDLRNDLLIRLLCAELEYNYQPPTTFRAELVPASNDENDQRVRPNLRLFLVQFPELRSRVDGIIQLSVLEYALRIRFDENPPDAASYIELCEQEQEQHRLGGLLHLTEYRIADSLPNIERTSAMIKSGDSTKPESTEEQPVILEQLPCNLGCFLVIRLMGRGGMGNVYSAIDLRNTAHVAVKVMRHLDSWSIYRFVEEFSWLSQLNHPHLVKLYDAFSEGDSRYFSMEQVEGLTIRNWFKSFTSNDPNRWNMLRQVLAEASSAIRFLHDCDVIHRDVKPSNLMITLAGRAMLLDLGLAMRSGKSSSGNELVDGAKIVGTIQYLPPEALRGEQPTFAGDWYSFGVLIFETITDSFPPVAIDPKNSDISLRYRLNEESLRDKLAGFPEDLVSLVFDLLGGDPVLRPMGNEIIRRLGAEDSQSISFAAETFCLGRDHELEQMTKCLNDASLSGKLILMRGESGIGKTTLLKHWTTDTQRREGETLLFHFSCHLQDHTPLRALNLLAQQIVTQLPELPRELWEDLTASEGAEIVYGFPQMQQLVNAQLRRKDPTIGVTELAARRAAGLHALLYWLRELSKRRLVIIAIDDVQWADADSGRLLAQLLATPSEFQGLIILADQGDAVASPLADSILNSQGIDPSAVVHLPLQPLGTEVCEALINKWAAAVGVQLTPEICDDITRRSSGNPFLLREVLSAYVNHVLQFKLDDEAWLKTTRSQRRSNHLRSRFSLLPISMERVLQYLAIADEPLGFHQLQMVSRVMPHELLPLTNYLASQGWIRINGTSLDSELEIAHDRFRDVVLGSMPEDRIHRRHYRIARTLSSESPPPWSRIAHHYWEAERFREAAACYMEAARNSARNNAFLEAIWYLQRAFHPNADRSLIERRGALRLQADCLAASGRSSEAIEAYRALTESSEDKRESNLLECLLGEQWISQGRYSQGAKFLSGALNDLAVSPDVQDSWLSAMRMWMGARHLAAAHGNPRDPKRSYQPFSAAEQSLSRIGTAMVFLDSRIGTRLIFALVNAAADRGTESDRAIALLRWATLISLGHRSARAESLAWLAKGRRLARTSQNTSTVALGQLCTCLWHFAQGQFVPSMKHGLKAQKLYRHGELTQLWEYGFLQWTMLILHWYGAKLKTLCEATRELRHEGQSHDNLMWIFWAHTNSAHLADLILDRVEDGRQGIELVRSQFEDQPFQSPRFFCWLSEIRQELYEGNVEAARHKLEQGWPLLLDSLLLKMTHYVWLAHSLRLCCYLAAAKASPNHKESYLKEARLSCKRLRGISDPAISAATLAQAFAIDAAQGKVAAFKRWKEVIDQLRDLDFEIFALATTWHASIHWPKEASAMGIARADARNVLVSQGCVHPEKLMQVIIPLP